MRTLALVVAVTLAGVLLRAVALSESLFGDELSAYFVVVGNNPDRLLDLVGSDQEVTPPLFFLLARATHGIGDSLRWVPFVAGVAAIPLTYTLGLLTVGRRAALTGAAVMAASPFLIFFSSEARPYALLMVLCLGSTIALARAVDEGPRWWWAL